ncbi:hypothetical protein N9K62_01220 [Candidatus Pelagibacter bacterium]|jgi:hypothetical protein|nr:hypothetical protein [Candidatus Pelagibacter bacterium]
MGFFTSNKDHLFSFFEQSTVEKKFLNIHRVSKNRNIEFISREESKYDTSHILRYNFIIKNKETCFTISKETTFSEESFENKYNSLASYMMTGVHFEGKLNNDDKNYIGLPKNKINKYPYIILKIESFVRDNKNYKNSIKKKEYLTLDNLPNSWRREVERDFHIISDKIIEDTLKNIK